MKVLSSSNPRALSAGDPCAHSPTPSGVLSWTPLIPRSPAWSFPPAGPGDARQLQET